MTVLIVSDTHNRNQNFKNIVEKVRPEEVFHLGDVERGRQEIEDAAGCPVFFVKGNCDFIDVPYFSIEKLGKHKCFLTHGHKYAVTYDTQLLAQTAKGYGCDIAFYGHTHVPDNTVIDGVHVLNPGSLSLPRQYPRKCSYIIADVDDGGEVHFSQAFLDLTPQY